MWRCSTHLCILIWCILFHAVAFYYFALQLADVFMLFPVDWCIYLFAALASVFNVFFQSTNIFIYFWLADVFQYFLTSRCAHILRSSSVNLFPACNNVPLCILNVPICLQSVSPCLYFCFLFPLKAIFGGFIWFWLFVLLSYNLLYMYLQILLLLLVYDVCHVQ